MSEITDLTAPSSPIAPGDSDGSSHSHSTKRHSDSSKDQKRRKRKKKQPVTSESPEDGEIPTNTGAGVSVEGTSSLFFIDLTPSPLLGTSESVLDIVPNGPTKVSESLEGTSEDQPVKLLLPAHVSLLNSESGVPVEVITRPEDDSDEGTYIEYLDYGDGKKVGMVRYFEEEPEEAKQTKIVCKNCGQEGDHKTFECPVQICLTCGARDEHSTRSCPISKTCYTCGMKGHINKTCPQRFSNRATRLHNYDDCDRCGSSRHNTNECPTLWRMYQYVSDTDRETTLQVREEKGALSVGEGGEAYIATDEWCYNCGESGHLGDDCNALSHPPDHPREPSAFSSYNIMSGPFFDAVVSSSKGKPRRPRDWEASNHLADGWGFNAPMNVGKQGRKKDRARMEQVARDQEEAEDPDDWFGDPRNARNRGMRRSLPARRNEKHSTSTISFGNIDRSRKIEFESEPPRPRRVDDRHREGRYRDERPPDNFSIRGAAGREYDPPVGYHRDRERSRRYDRSPESRQGRRDEHRPRYKGGYA